MEKEQSSPSNHDQQGAQTGEGQLCSSPSSHTDFPLQSPQNMKQVLKGAACPHPGGSGALLMVLALIPQPVWVTVCSNTGHSCVPALAGPKHQLQGQLCVLPCLGCPWSPSQHPHIPRGTGTAQLAPHSCAMAVPAQRCSWLQQSPKNSSKTRTSPQNKNKPPACPARSPAHPARPGSALGAALSTFLTAFCCFMTLLSIPACPGHRDTPSAPNPALPACPTPNTPGHQELTLTSGRAHPSPRGWEKEAIH